MRYILIACTWLALAAPAAATVVVPADLGELSTDAVAIARGRVVAVDAQWTTGRRSIETMVTLETEAYLKGNLGDTVQFRVPGGSMGRFQNVVVGAPRFVVGQRVVVFLGARGPMVPFVLGLYQGVFRISERADGASLITPPVAIPTTNGPIVRGRVVRQPTALAEFERQVRALIEDAR